jgi:hypothetical protein
MTPSVLLFTLLDLVGVPYGCFGSLVGIVMTLTYLWFMIRAVKEDFPRPAYPQWQPSPPGFNPGTWPPPPPPPASR